MNLMPACAEAFSLPPAVLDLNGIMENGIEALSLFLTAGAGVGAIIARHTGLYLHYLAFLCCISAIACLVLFLAGRVRAERVFLPLFFLLGAIAYLTSAMPPRAAHVMPFREAGNALRAAIDTLPFPHEGTAPLLKAFLTGDRSGLPKETVAVFRRSGASHLLALSGLHIGIIYTIFARGLSVFGNAPAIRVARFFVTVPAALWFTLMTGASPSIVRAFLFISLSELARLLGRRRAPLKVFATALLIQLVTTPSVITSVGFQLSYSAMLGIFIFFPPMRRWFPEGDSFGWVRKIWEVAALSIACQLTTAPIAWFYFHSFPRYFLITNLLTIPLTTVVITLALATLTLSAAGLWFARLFSPDPSCALTLASICPSLLLNATDFCSTLLLNATDFCATLLLRCLEVIAAL